MPKTKIKTQRSSNREERRAEIHDYLESRPKCIAPNCIYARLPYGEYCSPHRQQIAKWGDIK